MRNVLFSSSIVGFSISSFVSSFVSARVTVSLKVSSRSSFFRVVSSTTAVSASFAFFDETEGSASALSEPLVPQDTSWRLQKAYTFRTLVNEGAKQRYWNMLDARCQGSRCGRVRQVHALVHCRTGTYVEKAGNQPNTEGRHHGSN